MSLQELVEKRFAANFGGSPEVLATAPGRVEFIGNHTDYNQGTVIGAAIDRSVVVGLRRIKQPVYRFSSDCLPVVEVEGDADRRQSGSSAWVNYPLGVYHSLRKRGLKGKGGFEMAIESDVPSGAGLSSSAALELAAGKALMKAYGLKLGRAELALACREAENEFVGMPCGILDQGVSAFGEKGKLVHIDCRDMKFSTLNLGEEYRIWIFNTHKKHSLVDSLYAARHAECGEAVELLQRAGLKIKCLADVSVAMFEERRGELPEPVVKRAEHIVREIDRVRQVRALLAKGDVKAVGQLLYASHDSSRDLFENSVPELDYLVSILRSSPGAIGARLTGGGFGGAVMALAGKTFTMDYAEAVAAAYRGQFGEAPDVLPCRIADGARLLSA